MQVNIFAPRTAVVERIVNILSAISYPPRTAHWQIDDLRIIWGYVNTEYLINLVVEVTDVTNGQPTNVMVRGCQVNESCTDELILEQAYTAIQQFEAHECAEHFSYKGVKIHDPHASEFHFGVDPLKEAFERLQRRKAEETNYNRLMMFEGETNGGKWQTQAPVDTNRGIPSLPAATLGSDVPVRSDSVATRRRDNLQAVGSSWPGRPALTSRKGRIKVENGVYRLKSSAYSKATSKIPRRMA